MFAPESVPEHVRWRIVPHDVTLTPVLVSIPFFFFFIWGCRAVVRWGCKRRGRGMGG